MVNEYAVKPHLSGVGIQSAFVGFAKKNITFISKMLYRIDIPYGIRKFTLGETVIRHRIFGYGAAVAEPGIPRFHPWGVSRSVI